MILLKEKNALMAYVMDIKQIMKKQIQQNLNYV